MFRKSSAEALDRFMEKYEALGVNGSALAVMHNDEEVYRRYVGMQDADGTRAIQPDTLYRICSMTKIVTVTAAMQLYEKGLFILEDPVHLYLPEFKNMRVWDEAAKQSVPAKNVIRIRDLLSMTAGITYNGTSCETERETARLVQALEAEYPGCSYTTREFARRLAEVPLAFEPGTHWRYSHCHDVLGALIEVVSGMRLGEYIEKNIFAPLGMKNTFFRCPEGQWHRIAAPSGEQRGDFANLDSFGAAARYESGGGGLLSTLDDYMKFANTLTRGGTSAEGVYILGRKTLDLVRGDHLNEVQKADFNWTYLKGYSYGLGVRTYVNPAAGAVAGSVGEFGWCGILGSWVLMDPAEKLTAVYMHQRMPNQEAYVQPRLRSIIYAGI